MIDLTAYVRPGDGVWWSQAGAEATPLVDALLDQVGDIGPVRAFCGITLNGVAHLRGCPLPARAARLAGIAAPEYREALLRGQT